MALRLPLILLLLALAMVAESSTTMTTDAYITGGLQGTQTCKGLIGECIDQEDEMVTMDPENVRRFLAGKGQRYISYGALKKNQVPCNRRGSSYYGCGKASKVNPYKRGCSKITHCQRNID